MNYQKQRIIGLLNMAENARTSYLFNTPQAGILLRKSYRFFLLEAKKVRNSNSNNLQINKKQLNLF